MERILIIGPCGSCKSTLARELAQKLRLPLTHMDQLGWNPGWVETDNRDLLKLVEQAISGDRWLIEGNYGSTLPPRLARADTVLYLDFPIRLCLARIIRRVWTHRGQSRPDMPEGCPERFDLQFMLYVLNWNRGPRPRTEAAIAPWLGKVVRLDNPQQLANWLKAHDLG